MPAPRAVSLQRAVSTVGIIAQDIAQARDYASYENVTVLHQKIKQRLAKLSDKELRQVAALSMSSAVGMAAMLEASVRMGKLGAWEMFATPGDEVAFSIRDSKRPEWTTVSQPKSMEPCA